MLKSPRHSISKRRSKNEIFLIVCYSEDHILCETGCLMLKGVLFGHSTFARPVTDIAILVGHNVRYRKTRTGFFPP